MALNFPLNPASNAVYDKYTWDGEKWRVTAVSGGGGSVSPATAVPLVESGTGAVGTATKYAREDHVHPLGPGGGGSGGVAEPIIITTASASVASGTAAIAIQRTAPTATDLTLPAVASRSGVPLHIVDWSSSVVDHTITLTPAGTEKIMQAATWKLFSNPASLGSLTLYPSVTLNGWYIAP